jgi:hypothetical protein
MRSLLLALIVLVASPAAADPAAKKPVLDPLPFASGPLPGSPAIVIKTKPSTKHCGGTAFSATVKKSRSIAAPDRELAAVVVLGFPANLSSSTDAQRKASRKKFDAWFDAFGQASRAAADRYRDLIMDSTLPAAARVVAAARLMQASRWGAHVFARAPIPTDVAKLPEAVEVYCETMLEKAEPMAMFADEAAKKCRELVATLNPGAGWWDTTCAE